MPCSKKIITSNLGERGKDGISWNAIERNKAK
jgi:hypothetical protein